MASWLYWALGYPSDEEVSAIKIQKNYRGYKCKQQYELLKKYTLLVQQSFKRYQKEKIDKISKECIDNLIKHAVELQKPCLTIRTYDNLWDDDDDILDRIYKKEQRIIIKNNSHNIIKEREDAAIKIQRVVRRVQRDNLIDLVQRGAEIVGYERLRKKCYRDSLMSESPKSRDRRSRIIRAHKKFNKDNVLDLWDIDKSSQLNENNSYRKCIDYILEC